MAKKAHHPGRGHKVVKGASHGGGNLSLPKSGQSITVAPKKDRMAMNVGNHMGSKGQFGPGQEMMSSGNGAPKKFKETR